MQLAVESLTTQSICPQSTVQDYECRARQHCAQQHCAQCQSGNNGDDTVINTIVRHAMVCPISGFPLSHSMPQAQERRHQIQRGARALVMAMTSSKPTKEPRHSSFLGKILPPVAMGVEVEKVALQGAMPGALGGLLFARTRLYNALELTGGTGANSCKKPKENLSKLGQFNF